MSKTRVHTQLTRKLIAAAALALLTGSTAFAQLSVGDSGVTVDFSTAPTVAGGWSTVSIAGGAADITDAAALDASAQTLAASGITTALPSSTSIPPTGNALARWNNGGAGFYLQTRPTGNRHLALLATLQNGGTVDRSTVIITYDWAERINGGATGEQVPGHRCFYSLTGNANEWTLIPEFSTFTTTTPAGQLSATLDLSATPWTVGSLLYILWVDDNGSGGTETTGAGREGAYSIDNFSVGFSVNPPVIVTEPRGQTNAEYSVTSLNVVATGTGPFSYAWTKNGNPIGGNSPSLIITNTTASGFTWSRPEDSGDYQVTVTGAANPPAVSAIATVQILPDTNAPTFLWAIADTNVAGNLVIRAALSEPLSSNLDDYGNNNANLYWLLNKTAGSGSDLGSPDEVLLTNVVAATGHKTYLEIHFTYLSYTPSAIDPTTSYAMVYDNPGTPFNDRAQAPNQMVNQSTAVWVHDTQVIAYDDTWKYSDLDQQPPADWYQLSNNEADPFWKNGAGPFDGKRAATLPWCRTDSQPSYMLPPVGTCLVLSNDNSGYMMPSYYFRTHFQYPYQVQANAMLKLVAKFDDGAVLFLNGVELTRIGVNPTNPLLHTNYNSARTVGDTEPPDREYMFPASLLKSGDNVLAVYLAQINSTSSDITMGLKLISSTVAPLAPVVTGPRLNIQRAGSDLSISWNPPGGKLVSGPTIVGPWTTNAAPSNPTIVTPNQNQQFFFISE